MRSDERGRQKKSAPFPPSYTSLHTGIRNFVDGKHRSSPLPGNGEGLPEQHDIFRGILARRVTNRGGRAVGGHDCMIEACCAALLRHSVADARSGA